MWLAMEAERAGMTLAPPPSSLPPLPYLVTNAASKTHPAQLVFTCCTSVHAVFCVDSSRDMSLGSFLSMAKAKQNIHGTDRLMKIKQSLAGQY